MNQPPGGFPPGGPGQPGFPQQPYPPTQAVPATPAPAKPFQGTQLMPGSPGMPANIQAQIAAAQAAQQQAPYGAPPHQPYGQPPAQQGFGAPPPQQGFGAPPAQQGFGAPPMQQGGFGAPPPQQGFGGPPPQGAPIQQAPPPGRGGAIGFTGQGAYGMPRIKVGGDFAPDKLWRALATGQGYEKPRLMGLMMLGLSLAFTIGNSILIFGLHRYYPYLYGVGALFWWGGWWMVITGQPKLSADGTPCPLWARIGLGACLGIGALMGVAMCFFNWEAMLATAAINGAG